MSTKKIWYNPEAEYIGATGVNSVREMAELALADGDIPSVLCLYMDEVTVENIEAELNFCGVKPVTISVSHMRKESWDPDATRPCELDYKPGRGYTKVLGVHL